MRRIRKCSAMQMYIYSNNGSQGFGQGIMDCLLANKVKYLCAQYKISTLHLWLLILSDEPSSEFDYVQCSASVCRMQASCSLGTRPVDAKSDPDTS